MQHKVENDKRWLQIKRSENACHYVCQWDNGESECNQYTLKVLIRKDWFKFLIILQAIKKMDK